jgi:osmoprotectant transport system permease protein
VRGWLSALVSVLCRRCSSRAPVRAPRSSVGSKSFTESVILGEMIALLAEDAGAVAAHRRELGGSRILFNALRRGDLDLYPEYTGTLRLELLSSLGLSGDEEIPAALESMGLRMSAPLGFNNTYAIGVRPETAARLGLRRVSDLASNPGLALGFSNEFMDRADGWAGLRDAYGLANPARGIDHDLAYRALEAGSIAAIDLYSTDAEIAYYGLAVLEDDRGYFPRYEAVVLYRADLAARAPAVVSSVLRLEGAIDADGMSSLNEAVKIGRLVDGGRVRSSEREAAAGFVGGAFGVEGSVEVASLWDRLARTTWEQARIVGVSMALAVLAGVPLGIAAARFGRAAPGVLGVVGIVQTIPALALLVLLIKPFGLTATTAVVALFLYSLLPIVRNTHAGITGVGGDLIESAEAIGMGPFERLRRVELPLALPMILAGIKTAAVINIGTATLAALIGVGGYGQPILTGIRLDDFGLILEGALPAAGMAVAAQVLFDGLERVVVSPGVRRSAGG